MHQRWYNVSHHFEIKTQVQGVCEICKGALKETHKRAGFNIWSNASGNTIRNCQRKKN
jgi:hypothetical protein